MTETSVHGTLLVSVNPTMWKLTAVIRMRKHGLHVNYIRWKFIWKDSKWMQTVLVFPVKRPRQTGNIRGGVIQIL